MDSHINVYWLLIVVLSAIANVTFSNVFDTIAVAVWAMNVFMFTNLCQFFTPKKEKKGYCFRFCSRCCM